MYKKLFRIIFTFIAFFIWAYRDKSWNTEPAAWCTPDKNIQYYYKIKYLIIEKDKNDIEYYDENGDRKVEYFGPQKKRQPSLYLDGQKIL